MAQPRDLNQIQIIEYTVKKNLREDVLFCIGTSLTVVPVLLYLNASAVMYARLCENVEIASLSLNFLSRLTLVSLHFRYQDKW